MFSLQKKLKNESNSSSANQQNSSSTNGGTNSSTNSNNKRSLDMRQKLLQKEFESLIQLPVGCSLQFDNPDILYLFKLNVVPDKDSLWYGGKFEFTISVPEG
jgi:hypothetical protein